VDDELTVIAELPAVIRRKAFRLGGSRELPIDVRVFAASNRSLRQAIREGSLRQDLYYRLNVYTVELPPLRDRLEDLPLLAAHFIREFNREHNKNIEGVGQDCLDALRTHHWPGNVRELRNVIQRAVIRCSSQTPSAKDLPVDSVPQHGSEAQFIVHLGSSVREVERELIVRTLAYAAGNKTRASDILGMSRRNLYNRLNGHAGGGVQAHLNGHVYRNGRNRSS
jgi:transcriptional regulator with PAS, ATPase and Fis domain